MKKILYVGYTPNMGGIERFLLNICKNIDRRKFEISFLIFKDEKVYNQDELEKMGCNFFEITKRKKNYIQYCKDLKDVYNENEFDIIHFNLMTFCAFEMIVLAQKYSTARLIIHSHTGGLNKKYKRTIIFDKIGRFFVRNIPYERIACGRKAGKWLFRDKDFTVLNNGMEIEKFGFNLQNRIEIRNKLKVNENTKVFGHVGAMFFVKNHKFLINVFYEYQKMERNSKLILIGDGFLKSNLEKQIQKLKIQDKVVFLGIRDDVEKIYSAMDIFVMPSLFEGFSIALMEAQINGLKCYTSNNISEECDVTGNTFFLPLERNSKYWAEKIYKTGNSRDKNAMNKIPNQFKIEKMVDALMKIYEEN